MLLDFEAGTAQCKLGSSTCLGGVEAKIPGHSAHKACGSHGPCAGKEDPSTTRP